jgi:hypothetical protein
VRLLELSKAEERALAGLLQSEAGDCGPLLDLLERLAPTHYGEELL